MPWQLIFKLGIHETHTNQLFKPASFVDRRSALALAMLKLYDKDNKEITDSSEYCENPACLGEPWCSAWGHCKDTMAELNEIDSLLERQIAELEDDDKAGVYKKIAGIPLGGAQPGSSSGGGAAARSTAAESKRFGGLKTEEEVTRVKMESIPAKTRADTDYCFRVFEEWRKWRNTMCASSGSEEVPDITTMNKPTLSTWLCHFILEMRKKNGKEYPPNTLHHICCGLMRYLRAEQPDIDFFKDPEFSDFKATLDGEMKRLQKNGIGSKKKQAEPITEEEEELLWSTGQLGDHSPQALVDTMLFMCGVYFALRSGQEHRNLRFNPPQIELIEEPGKRSYLRYTEDLSKNNPGELKGRKHKPKVVVHYANQADTSRCFVRLFKLYCSKCPPDRPNGAFYLKPAVNCRPHWYTNSPIGHTTLANTVGRMCKAAGITGYKTNHSLRATAATRLFQAGVDEQLIMEKTGHFSVEGVRSYKRTSSEQQESLSDILSLSKKPHLTSTELAQSHNSSSAAVQQTHNQNIMLDPDNLKNMFTLNNCTGINIHFHFK